jgi:hypothetical protein
MKTTGQNTTTKRRPLAARIIVFLLVALMTVGLAGRRYRSLSVQQVMDSGSRKTTLLRSRLAI